MSVIKGMVWVTWFMSVIKGMVWVTWFMSVMKGMVWVTWFYVSHLFFHYTKSKKVHDELVLAMKAIIAGLFPHGNIPYTIFGIKVLYII